MQIEKIPVEKLKAAEYNPRRALKPGDAGCIPQLSAFPRGFFLSACVSPYPSSRSIRSSFGLLLPMGVSQLSFTIW